MHWRHSRRWEGATRLSDAVGATFSEPHPCAVTMCTYQLPDVQPCSEVVTQCQAHARHCVAASTARLVPQTAEDDVEMPEVQLCTACGIAVPEAAPASCPPAALCRG